MEDNKDYCDFCGDYIPTEDKNQFWFIVDGFLRHYCSKCKKHGDIIQKAVERKINQYKSNNQYYSIENIFKLTEALYKNRNGDIKISFDNKFNYKEDIIGTPITKDNLAIGFITDVNEEKVSGCIWSRYIPIIAEMKDNVIVSFEIVY